jgi:DNA-binding beta-propeller fold protein YncE
MDLYNHRVQKFTDEGQFLMAWGQKEKVSNFRSIINFLFDEGLPGKFYYPARIAVHPDGEVYVSDSYNNRVQVFTKDETLLRKWGGMGFWGGRFRVASDISFDQKGRTYVADYYNHRVQVFTKDGRYLAQWGSEGSGPGEFKGPTGLAIDQASDIYVVDWGNHRIQKFRGGK